MNSPASSLKNLVDYLNDTAHLFCARRRIRLHVEVDGQWPPTILQRGSRTSRSLSVAEGSLDERGKAQWCELRGASVAVAQRPVRGVA